jgi:hypothetical protein
MCWCLTALAAPPAWVAKCATRMNQARADFVKLHPKYKLSQVAAEHNRVKFEYPPRNNVLFNADIRGSQKRAAADWQDQDLCDGCSPELSQIKAALDRVATIWVFNADDEAATKDFEKIFKPALDACFAY